MTFKEFRTHLNEHNSNNKSSSSNNNNNSSNKNNHNNVAFSLFCLIYCKCFFLFGFCVFLALIVASVRFVLYVVVVAFDDGSCAKKTSQGIWPSRTRPPNFTHTSMDIAHTPSEQNIVNVQFMAN